MPVLPAGAVVGVVGAVAAAGSLALPWVAGSLGTETMMGRQDSLVWVALRVVATVAVVVLALRLVDVAHGRETRRVVFAAAAVVFALRPIYWLAFAPEPSVYESVGSELVPAQAPAYGLAVSLVGAVLMVVAAVLTHRAGPDPVRPERKPKAPPVAAPATKPYLTAAEEAALLRPTVVHEGPAYGAEGPSRLGEAASVVVEEDRLAPRGAKPAPHLALLGDRAAQVRRTDSPETSAAPRPVPAAPAGSAAPQRSRGASVAPPGSA